MQNDKNRVIFSKRHYIMKKYYYNMATKLQNDNLRISFWFSNVPKSFFSLSFSKKFKNQKLTFCVIISQGEEQTAQAPVFTSSMKTIEVKEGQRAHFECKIIPVSDPTLKVEWFHNGQPLKQGK